MKLIRIGEIQLPSFSGIRIMMMPFLTDDVRGSLPTDYEGWYHVISLMSSLSPGGVGYLTIDEAMVRGGETHRRPGLHVDGLGGWGGGGGWGSGGFTTVSSHIGCEAWDQDFVGTPGYDGDCAHFKDELDPDARQTLQPKVVYWCDPMLVHRSIASPFRLNRQFCRVSFPSDSPWYEGYTENPLGIKPTGQILPARTEQMNYRP